MSAETKRASKQENISKKRDRDIEKELEEASITNPVDGENVDKEATGEEKGKRGRKRRKKGNKHSLQCPSLSNSMTDSLVYTPN